MPLCDLQQDAKESVTHCAHADGLDCKLHPPIGDKHNSSHKTYCRK